MKRELTFAQTAERSIVKKYRKELWTPFITAVQRYALIEEGDRIAVCISGGKDSMLLAKLMQEVQRHGHTPFEAVYLCMDPGYQEENRKKIAENADRLGIPLTVFENRIFDIAYGQQDSPCYLCAKMRRGALYAKAKALGCNKIALGHHLNDVIETTVMGLFWSGMLRTMPPKLRSLHFDGMELIRPLYCVREEDIIAWQNYNGLDFLACACRFTESKEAEENHSSGKRLDTKLLLKKLKEENPTIEQSIFRALHTVNIESFPGWKAEGKEHSFLEWY